MERMLSIGEAAQRAGVSVQTLRHYDKLGLLPPTQTTEAGYRLYSTHACLRLELIRTLRDVGFDLSTIGQLLKDKQSTHDAIVLRLEVLESQSRALQRQQVLLKAVLNGQGEAMLSNLRRLDVLARLDKLEREAFLAKQLGWNPDNTHGSREIWEAAVLDLPDDMSGTQLEAWLELAELVSDQDFQHILRRQLQPFEGLEASRVQSWTERTQALMAEALQAVRHQECADSEVAQAIVNRWIEAFADALEKTPDAAVARWMLEHLETTNDPRFERYWHLVTALKGWAYTDSYTRATRWLLEGLRVRVAGT